MTGLVIRNQEILERTSLPGASVYLLCRLTFCTFFSQFVTMSAFLQIVRRVCDVYFVRIRQSVTTPAFLHTRQSVMTSAFLRIL